MVKVVGFTYKSKSALHQAAMANATRSIQLLLDYGWAIDQDLGEFGTPLHMAADSFNTREAAVLLLERGANLFCCRANGEGFNVLHRAVENPDLLLQGEQQFSLSRTLIESCPERFLPVKDELLQSVDSGGRTVMEAAIIRCDAPTVQLLVELGGTDLAKEIIPGMTPLVMALQHVYFGSRFVENILGEIARRVPQAELLVFGDNLSDQAWMKQRYVRISELLVEAGSPIPAIEELTGEYELLLRYAALQIAQAIEENPDCDRHHELQEAFREFRFMREGGVISWSEERREVAIFPRGIHVGSGQTSPMIQISLPMLRTRS